MKPIEVRKKTVDELKKHVLDLKKELMNLRFQRVSGQNENTARFKQIRNDVARMKTIILQKQNAETAKA